jgi:hypothetical protein
LRIAEFSAVPEYRGRHVTETADLKQRTKDFAARILKMVDALPQTTAGRNDGQPGGAVGDFGRRELPSGLPSPLQGGVHSEARIVEEEADETLFWLELIEDSGLLPPAKLADLKTEANELVAITVASIRTARSAPR